MSTEAWIVWALAIAGAYLLGSVPTGYLLVKKLKGVDIRDFGSGNIGATNVKRVAGNKAFATVLLLDFMKGFLPVLAVKWLLPQAPILHVLVAMASVLGHSKSIFFGFTGGKSAATGLGGIVGLAPIPGLLLAGLAFVIIKLGRIVSIGTMTAAVVGPILLYLFKAPLAYVIYSIIVALYVIYLHKANIGRLMSGTENRI